MTKKPNSGYSDFATFSYFGLVLLLGTVSIVVTQLVLNMGTAGALDAESTGEVLLIGIVCAWFLLIIIGIISYHFERRMVRTRPDRRSAWTWAAYTMLIAITLVLSDTYIVPIVWESEEVLAVSLSAQVPLLLPVSIMPLLILLLGNQEQRRLSKYNVIKYIRPGSP
jgi:uncharacterized membrane protein YidH (DUF202 family)